MKFTVKETADRFKSTMAIIIGFIIPGVQRLLKAPSEIMLFITSIKESTTFGVMMLTATKFIRKQEFHTHRDQRNRQTHTHKT